MNTSKMNSKYKILALSLFFLLCHNQFFAQGWLSGFLTSGGTTNVNNEIVHIPSFIDGKTHALGYYPEGDNFLFIFSQIEENGHIRWNSNMNPTGSTSGLDHLPRSSVMIGLDTVIVLAGRINPETGEQDIFIYNYYDDHSSTINFPTTYQWSYPLFVSPSIDGTGAALTFATDGNLIALGAIKSEVFPDTAFYELLLVKIQLDGQILWTKMLQNPLDDQAVQVIPSPDNGYWVLTNSHSTANTTDTEIRLIKTDFLGNQQWEVTVGAPNDVSKDMILTSTGDLAITGHNSDQDLFVLRLAANGAQLWRQDYPTTDRSMLGNGIIEDHQANLIIAGEQIITANSEIDAFLAKLTAGGIPLWERYYGKPGEAESFNDVEITPSGQYLMGGYIAAPQLGNGRLGYFIKTDTLGIIRGGIVKGNVFQDLNADCLPNMGEINLENWKVQVANDSLNFYGNTDAQGNYWIPVNVASGDEVDYLVSLIPPSSYWEPCTNDIPITIAYQDTVSIDFPVEAIVQCPFPEVQIGTSILRPCEMGLIYIDYCNEGTVSAENAQLEVTLDEYLSFDNASITPSQVDGQTYTFPLGDLAINQCGQLQIEVLVDCNMAQIGDVVCIEAHITPDTLCLEEENWSGALLQLDYTCTDDELRFTIENVGTASMQNAQNYIIIEDAVLLMQGNFDLNPTENAQSLPLPLNGATYHLIAPQEPGAPGAEWISIGSNGCSENHAPQLNQFLQNSGDPFTDIQCVILRGSYDPNDKLANPSGIGIDHEVLPNTDLQYTIRFQNVGTDTAHRVIIRDTLSALLDPASIVPGPSSHSYTWRLEDSGIVTFNFYNIDLPDSTTNLAASQGFVTFKIDQRRNLEVGSVVENSAAIYFDFNAPVITNTTFHTISDLLEIVSGSVTVADPATTIKVVPNPMQDGAWIVLQGGNANLEPWTFRLFDVSGRNIRTLQGNSHKIWLDRNELTSGMYFFTLEKAGQWQASGKLAVK